MRERLAKDPPAEEMKFINERLVQDHLLLKSLLEYTAVSQSKGSEFRRRLLDINFRLMLIWFALTHRFAPPQAKRSLLEMVQIIHYFANDLGERTEATFRS